VATGARAASTDCLGDAAIARRRAAAARAARRRLGRACSVEAAAALHLGGDCAEAHTPDAVAGCLVGTHDADADAVLAVTDAAPAALPEAARACQLEATGRTREVLLGRVHLLTACHRHPPRALAAGSDCAEYPPLAARLARLGSRAAARIAARCGGAALGAAHFGVPCDAPADGGTLAQCLLGVAGATAADAIGAETRAKGGSMILAPVVNILRHPRWGRAQETYGEDTVHLGRMGVAFVRGAQRHVIANPKHYALNSIEDTRFTVDVTVDERSLREVFLPHFRRA